MPHNNWEGSRLPAYAIFMTGIAVMFIVAATYMDHENNRLTHRLDVLHAAMLDSKQTIKYMDEYDFYIYSVDGEVRFTAKTLEELLDQIGETK